MSYQTQAPTSGERITESSGAKWLATKTGPANSDRALWVFLLSGKSQAKPGVVGFYAKSLNEACEALNN